MGDREDMLAVIEEIKAALKETEGEWVRFTVKVDDISADGVVMYGEHEKDDDVRVAVFPIEMLLSAMSSFHDTVEERPDLGITEYVISTRNPEEHEEDV